LVEPFCQFIVILYENCPSPCIREYLARFLGKQYKRIMETTAKKGMISKRLAALSILVFSSLYGMAGVTDKVKNALSKEFNSLQGVWIMLGLIGGGLTLYVIMNKIQKKQAEKEAAQASANPNIQHHHHRRHHRHKVVKKTS
jgi:hypothetical protein